MRVKCIQAFPHLISPHPRGTGIISFVFIWWLERFNESPGHQPITSRAQGALLLCHPPKFSPLSVLMFPGRENNDGEVYWSEEFLRFIRYPGRGRCPHLQNSNRHPGKCMNMNMPSSHTTGCHESQIGEFLLWSECDILHRTFKVIKKKIVSIKTRFSSGEWLHYS